MRFMLLLIRARGAPAVSTAGYDDALRRAGILLAHDRLDREGAARVRAAADGARVVGAAEAGGAALDGYWTIQARSRDEAIEWARRCPTGAGDAVEVHRLHDAGTT